MAYLAESLGITASIDERNRGLTEGSDEETVAEPEAERSRRIGHRLTVTITDSRSHYYAREREHYLS